MKKLYPLIAGLMLCACSKKDISPLLAFSDAKQNDFIKYTIPAGHQYCDQSTYIPIDFSELKFTARFDSSAIYHTLDPINQFDINKLYGFSDNNSGHHSYSARFGWRWSQNALRLFGYTYNNGVRESKELGIVKIGVENNCSIKIAMHQYYFTLNGITDSMERSSTTGKALGYKLYPYFGGDELAPHEINIWIKESLDH